MTSTLISQKFEVICVVGQGGQGTVYKVRHTGLNTICALKLLAEHLAKDPSIVARFAREARTMARLHHPNIVKVTDYDHDDNLHYIVEEFIEGSNLTNYVKAHHPLPLADVLEIARQLADALRYAHSERVTHRDIKPSNVLIEDKLPLRARLTDFGIAKVADANNETQTGTLLGTIRYASPEQLGYRDASGRTREVDGRADIYGLGLVMFEMCEGIAFFDGLEHHEVIGTLVYKSEPLVPHFSRPIPQKLVAIITKAICRDPAERYQSMDELLAAILAAIGDCRQTRSQRTSNDSTAIHLVDPLLHPAGKAGDQGIENRIRTPETERQRRLVRTGRDGTQVRPTADESATSTPAAKADYRDAASPRGQHLPHPTPDRRERDEEHERITPQPYIVQPPPPRRPRRSYAWLWSALAATAVGVITFYLVYIHVPEPPPPRSRAAILADLSEHLKGFTCGRIGVADFVADTGTVHLGGTVESEEQRQQVRQAVQGVPEAKDIQDSFIIVPRPFCEVIELLRPLQARSQQAGWNLLVHPQNGCDAVYKHGESLVFTVAAEKPLRYVYVDYYVADRQAVAHLFPTAKQHDDLPQATTLTLGAAGSETRWSVEPPFGAELVTVVTSPQPLLPKLRPPVDQAVDYIDELRKNLASAGTSSDVSAAYCFIKTEDR